MTDPRISPPFTIDFDVRRHEGDRRFRIQGEIWCVHEDHHQQWGCSLIFESDKIARRVRNYPQNWHELPEEQLYALSWSR